MSQESNHFTHDQIIDELLEQTAYAIRMLSASRDALLESHIGKEFNWKVPKPVIMHAVSRALTDCIMPQVDYKKLHRGIISLVIFFLEDEDVNIALKIKKELCETDKE